MAPSVITAYVAALKAGDAKGVRTAIESGLPRSLLDDVAQSGQTALTRAASLGQVEIVEVLLEAGADANRADKTGMKPLHAALKGKAKSCEQAALALLSAGADPSAICDAGKSDDGSFFPLGIAIKERRSVNLALTLIEAGAPGVSDVTVYEEAFKREVLYFENHLNHAIKTFSEDDAIRIIEAAVARGSSLSSNEDSAWSTSPLIEAIKHQSWRVVDRLLDLGADPTEPDVHGQTVLQVVARNHPGAGYRYGGSEKFAVMERLMDAALKAGVGIDQGGKSVGEAPLLLTQDKRIAELLIARGADIRSHVRMNLEGFCNYSGNYRQVVDTTPLARAIARGNGEIVDSLLKAGAPLAFSFPNVEAGEPDAISIDSIVRHLLIGWSKMKSEARDTILDGIMTYAIGRDLKPSGILTSWDLSEATILKNLAARKDMDGIRTLIDIDLIKADDRAIARAMIERWGDHERYPSAKKTGISLTEAVLGFPVPTDGALLRSAIQCRDMEACNILIGNGAKPTLGMLGDAIRSQWTEGVSRLLDEVVPEKTYDVEDAFSLAVASRKPELVALLIERLAPSQDVLTGCLESDATITEREVRDGIPDDEEDEDLECGEAKVKQTVRDVLLSALDQPTASLDF